MRSLSNPSTCREPNKYPGRLRAGNAFTIATAAILLASSPLSAQVVANFADGNTADETDGFLGKAGSGWTSAWATDSNAGSNDLSTYTVASATPLTSGSATYLATKLEKDVTAARLTHTYRSYESFGTLDTSTVHSVSLLHRFDSSFLATNERFYVYDGVSMTPRDGDTTWAIGAFGGTSPEWGFSTGATFGAQASSFPDNALYSGVLVQIGHTYQMEITIDPANNRFRGLIIDLDYVTDETPGLESYQSSWLDFQTKDQGTFDVLNIGARWIGTSAKTYSTSDITIIPEPAIMTLWIGLIAVVILIVRPLRGKRLR